ncbi:MAG: hypothetical protein JNG82_12655 [Opitutaceae bacterium]|nr:hypothetical protein [Opitutaceae bacterium]
MRLGIGLLLAGCVSQRVATQRVEPAAEFTVVRSSTNKELTPEQLSELRQAVGNYLRKQGLTGNRLYEVKVQFAPKHPEDEPEWVIVRIGRLPERTYTLLAVYPGPDDYYPYDYYRNGYYNPAYGGFSRWGYYDPFEYNYGGYSRPVPPRHDHGRPNHPNKPDDKPDHPPGTRTRWDNTPRTNSDQPRSNAYPPRTANPERWARERSDNRGGYTRSEPSYTGDRASNPPPDRSYSAPSHSDSTPSRVGSFNAGIQQAASTEKEK